VKREQVLRFRLARHGLRERRPLTPAQAAACAASDFSRDAAMLALAARSELLTRAGYEEAVDSGALVLAPTLRGAIHALAPEDFSLLGRALLATDDDELARQIGRQMQRLVAMTGIAATVALEEVSAATSESLSGGRKLTRNELHEELRSRVREELMPWCKGCKSHHVAPMLWRFGGVRAGMRRDSQGRFLIGRPKPTGKPAPSGAVRHFLRFYGPAKARDFVSWSGVPRELGARLWDEVAGDLAEVEWQGGSGFILADDGRELEAAPQADGARLIPPNDPYLVQPDRATLVPDAALRKRIFRPIASPGVVLVNGRIAGLWKVRARGKRSAVEIEELGRLPRRKLAAEAERIASLRGSADIELSWT